MTPAQIRRIEDSFARQALMATFAARLSAIASGRVDITAPILPLATQQHGVGHAGLTFALADTAAGYAALTMMDDGAEVMTAEAKINLLAPARGQALRATGKVIKAGRRLIVVTAEIHALDQDVETLIGILQGTMASVRP